MDIIWKPTADLERNAAEQAQELQETQQALEGYKTRLQAIEQEEKEKEAHAEVGRFEKVLAERQARAEEEKAALQNELDKSSKDLYFSKLIKDGEISKEGRDALRDKYYLSPKMYEAWQPPQLEDTKLYFLAPKKNRDSVDAGLLSIHGRSLFRQIEHYLKSIFLAGSEKRPRSALPHWSISPAPRTWTTSLLLLMTGETHRCVKDQRLP